jgi:hypothetical protein
MRAWLAAGLVLAAIGVAAVAWLRSDESSWTFSTRTNPSLPPTVVGPPSDPAPREVTREALDIAREDALIRHLAREGRAHSCARPSGGASRTGSAQSSSSISADRSMSMPSCRSPTSHPTRLRKGRASCPIARPGSESNPRESRSSASWSISAAPESPTLRLTQAVGDDPGSTESLTRAVSQSIVSRT